MNDWWSALAGRYGTVALGLGVGTLAKYGLALSEGRSVTWRMILIDGLMMAMLALVAMVVVDRLGLSGNGAVLVAALFAISSDRALRLVLVQFEKRVVGLADALLAKGEMRQASAIQESARHLEEEGVHAPTTAKAAAARVMRAAPPIPKPEDDDLLGKIEDDEPGQ